MTKSICKFKVQFNDTNEIAKAFLISNKGVMRQKNLPPANYTATTPIWNLNLPLFAQKKPWRIDNFKTNFRKIRPKGDKIKAGKKTLKFLGVKEAKLFNKLDDMLS
jgi:hypothetical protein